MMEYELFFSSAGRDSGAEQGTTTIREGVSLINDRLCYDQEQVELMAESGAYKFHGTAPTIYVAKTCKNLIFSLTNWTGRDGAEGAMKDPVDVLRYLTIANPVHVETLEWSDGGGVY
jgi:hypothetical protein